MTISAEPIEMAHHQRSPDRLTSKRLPNGNTPLKRLAIPHLEEIPRHPGRVQNSLALAGPFRHARHCPSADVPRTIRRTSNRYIRKDHPALPPNRQPVAWNDPGDIRVKTHG